MRLVLLISTFVLFASTVFAAEFNLNYELSYSPPAGDIIIADKIGRYVIDITPEYKSEFFRLEVSLKAYGVTDWISPSQRGHGIDKYTTDYAWKADEWRYATTQKVEIGREDLYFFAFNYMPIDRHTKWGKGNGQESNYYYLIGVGGSLNLWSSK
jgi:hypothetical protein